MSAILDALRKAGDKYRRKYKDLIGVEEDGSKQTERSSHKRPSQKHPNRKKFLIKIFLTTSVIVSLILIIVCIIGIYIIFKSLNKVDVIDKKYEKVGAGLVPAQPNIGQPQGLPLQIVPTQDLQRNEKVEPKKLEKTKSNETIDPLKGKIKFKVTLEDLTNPSLMQPKESLLSPVLMGDEDIKDLDKSDSEIQVKSAKPQQKEKVVPKVDSEKRAIEKAPSTERSRPFPTTIRIDDSSLDEQKEKGITVQTEKLNEPKEPEQKQAESKDEIPSVNVGNAYMRSLPKEQEQATPSNENQSIPISDQQVSDEEKVSKTESNEIPDTSKQNSKYTLEGIVWDDKGALAIINGSMVKVGDMIEGGKVKKISKNSVELEIDGKTQIIYH